MRRKALITGASGQDGPYLANELIGRGYEVWGLIPSWDPRRHDVERRERRMKLIEADLLDPNLAPRLLDHVEPDVIYNLAAITYVPSSWEEVDPVVTTNGQFPVRMLEAIRTKAPATRFYQASTSEMFGSSPPPQNEDTPFKPVSPYAAAKLLAHHAVNVYRESYGLFAVSGILFNHESPWRGREFVTRHVTISLARLTAGQIKPPIPIGLLTAQRDWGHARDYVRAMIAMMEADEPRDFVVATGVTRTVGDLIEVACGLARVSQSVFEFSPKRLRIRETAPLQGDPSRIRDALGWVPRYSFREMIEEMLDADIQRVEDGEL